MARFDDMLASLGAGAAIPGVMGVGPGRTFDAVVAARAPALPGDRATFVALEDGTLIVGDDVPDGALGPIADAIEEMVGRIVERFDPERIILFGSHARGSAGPDSDVDLLVVMPVVGSKRAKQIEVRLALHDISFPKDVIVTTPEEFARRKEVPGTIEWPAAREGRVVYARP